MDYTPDATETTARIATSHTRELFSGFAKRFGTTVDGGDLDNSWRQQPGTPAYCRDLGAAALRRALTEADRSRIAEYRAAEEARIRRSIEAQKPGASARQ